MTSGFLRAFFVPNIWALSEQMQDFHFKFNPIPPLNWQNWSKNAMAKKLLRKVRRVPPLNLISSKSACSDSKGFLRTISVTWLGCRWVEQLICLPPQSLAQLQARLSPPRTSDTFPRSASSPPRYSHKSREDKSHKSWESREDTVTSNGMVNCKLCLRLTTDKCACVCLFV